MDATGWLDIVMSSKPKYSNAQKLHVHEQAAKACFSFLELTYGFHQVKVQHGTSSAGRLHVRYESPRVYVDLFFGPPGYELDICFGRIGVEDQEGKYSCTAGDLLYLNECQGWSGYATPSASTPDRIRKYMPELARLMRECGSRCLKGEDDAYEEIARKRRKHMDRFVESEMLDRMRQTAAAAWKDKNFAEVVHIYESMRNELTPLEKESLAYARKHC